MLAKEECAKRIAEERQGGGGGDSNKLSGDQLTQLEMRLKEAEEAMERAMEKMGLDIRQLKQDTGYKDPLAQSLEELKRTMATIATDVPKPTSTSSTPSPATDQSQIYKEAVSSDDQQLVDIFHNNLFRPINDLRFVEFC